MKIKSEGEERVIKLFGSISRARILTFLLAHAGQSFYQREIMYETGLSLRPVQRELINLLALGIIKKQTTNNRVFCQINTASSLFKPLREICNLVSDERVSS
jgi:predicted DNA-binding transcriptional regulator